MRRTATIALVVIAISLAVIAGLMVKDHFTKPKVVAAPSIEKLISGMDDLPKCSDIWVVGKKLPAKYQGCQRGNNMEIVIIEPCNGVVLLEYGSHGFYTDHSRIIHDGGADYANTPAYQALCS